MKLSEYKSQAAKHVLVYGPPKSGKTGSLAALFTGIEAFSGALAILLTETLEFELQPIRRNPINPSITLLSIFKTFLISNYLN